MLLSEETLKRETLAREFRRSLHRIPENGLEEWKTQKFVLETLAALGVEAAPLAGTGVKAVIAGEIPGPVTALRADMDALNVEEKTGCGFESAHPGWMHACGHDGHMAALLAAAELLQENRGAMRGTAVLLFQPCEELVNGAELMIAQGALENPHVDRAFAMHLMPHIPEGSIGVVSGPAMAGACEFAIDVLGRSAHAAMPHLAVDAVAAAAQFVCSAQSVISRGKPPEAPGLLTFGRFHGGVRHNIIADRVELEGTLRCYDDALMQTLRQRLLAHLNGMREAWGADAEFRVKNQVPVTANDGELAKLAFSLYPEACVAAQPLMVAEDFCHYCRVVPGFMGFLGCRNEHAGYTESLHSGRFNFDEHALLPAVEFYKRLFIS